MNSKRGFTIIELLVTLVVFSILLSIALPAFANLIDRQRLDGAVDALSRSLNYTRMEAVRRNRAVTISPFPGGWHQGWRVYLDRNLNGMYDDDETLIREETPPVVSAIKANASIAQYVQYNPQGETILLNGGFQAGTFTLCSSKAGAEGRKIIINRVGRVRSERSVTDCSGKA